MLSVAMTNLTWRSSTYNVEYSCTSICIFYLNVDFSLSKVKSIQTLHKLFIACVTAACKRQIEWPWCSTGCHENILRLQTRRLWIDSCIQIYGVSSARESSGSSQMSADVFKPPWNGAACCYSSRAAQLWMSEKLNALQSYIFCQSEERRLCSESQQVLLLFPGHWEKILLCLIINVCFSNQCK